jgi:cell wall-associated NlpC family hydrolase
MSHVRNVLLLLCIASALAVSLAKPLPARGDAAAPPAPVPPPPSSTSPILQPLALVKLEPKSKPKPKQKLKPKRRTQLHLPFGRRIADFARHFVGTPYVWGGTSPRSGFDCSGLVQYVYAHFGVSLPRTTYGQFDRGSRVGRWGLRPGDLVFFDGVGHVGMYIGDGRFIHAPHTGTRVRIQTLAGWYGSEFVGARRFRPA